MWVTFFGINWCVNSQVGMIMSVLVDGTLDGLLGGSLGSDTVRTDGSSEIDDVPSCGIVDETCREGREQKAKKHESISSRHGRSAQGEGRNKDPKKRETKSSPWT